MFYFLYATCLAWNNKPELNAQRVRLASTTEDALVSDVWGGSSALVLRKLQLLHLRVWYFSVVYAVFSKHCGVCFGADTWMMKIACHQHRLLSASIATERQVSHQWNRWQAWTHNLSYPSGHLHVKRRWYHEAHGSYMTISYLVYYIMQEKMYSVQHWDTKKIEYGIWWFHT